MAIEFPEQRLKKARILAYEEWGDAVQEDRVGVDHVHGVGYGDPLDTVGRPHADEEIPPVAEQFDRSDLDRVVDALDVEDRDGRDLVESPEEVTVILPGSDPPS